jgi:hypothetical protein
MKNFLTILSGDMKLIVHLKDFTSIQDYLNFILNNADKLPAIKEMSDIKLVSLEQIIDIAYRLGYQHGEDFMDGKRSQDSLVEETVYTEYEGSL